MSIKQVLEPILTHLIISVPDKKVLIPVTVLFFFFRVPFLKPINFGSVPVTDTVTQYPYKDLGAISNGQF